MCSCKTDDYFHLIPIFFYSGEELVLSFEVHIPDVREGKAAMNRNPVTYEKFFFFKSVWQKKEIS